MDQNLFAYIQHLELMFFFSAYPLLYAAVVLISGNQLSGNYPESIDLKSRILLALPYAYALLGTLYVGFLLRNLYPDYSPRNIRMSVHQPLLISWGILSVFFWIPFFAKKKLLTLIHSLVFFFFIVRDVILQISGANASSDNLKNDMNIFSFSLLLNVGALATIVFLSFFFLRNKKV